MSEHQWPIPVKAGPTRRRRVFNAVTAPLARKIMVPGQQARAAQFARLPSPTGAVVFLGDSITEQGMWNEWFPEVRAVNRGIGGETSAQVFQRLDTAIDHPRAVFLLIGTNDLATCVPIPTIVSTIDAILTGIEDRALGTPVFVQSVMPRKAAYRDEVLLLNQRIREVGDSKAKHIRYVDLWPVLATAEGTLIDEYTPDHLHLNGQGYAVWTDAIRPLVAAIGAVS